MNSIRSSKGAAVLYTLLLTFSMAVAYPFSAGPACDPRDSSPLYAQTFNLSAAFP
ncbi:MAG TPA: hypothetical protein VF306_08700 [Pirellulales bacterium]